MSAHDEAGAVPSDEHRPLSETLWIASVEAAAKRVGCGVPDVRERARGAAKLRIALDAYETPLWVPDQAYEDCISCLPGGRWIEPGAGHGNFIRAINARRRDIDWTAVELRPECGEALQELGCQSVLIGDFLETSPPERPYDVAIGNPPFSLAREWVDWCRRVAKRTVLLLRMGLLESEARVEWLRGGVMPERVFVLPHRPHFAHGKTDSCVYAFMQWGQGHNTRAELSVLPAWPAELRGARARRTA